MNELAARRRTAANAPRRRATDATGEVEEASFRSLAETSLQGIIVHRDWRILFANQAAAQSLGFAEIADLVAVESLLELFLAEERLRVESYRDARLKGEPAPERYQTRLLHRDGSIIHVEMLASTLDWQGEPAVQAAFVDITDSMEAQQMLRESEERFRNLVEGSLQGIAIVDAEFSPLFVNGAYASIFGYRSAEQMQRIDCHLDLYVGDDRNRVLAYGETRLRGDAVPNTYEVDGVRQDGDIVHMVNTMRLIAWKGGPAFQITATDITEWKRTEARLHGYQEHLRRLASEISFAEEKERRRIASELHDGTIQNLALAKIKLGELEKGAAEGPERRSLGDIRELLDTSIQDARSLIFELSPPVLYELGLEAAAEWLGEQFQSRYGITCRVSTGQGREPIQIHIEVMLFQVLRELLVNVIKHADATWVDIALHRTRNGLQLRVSDNGNGFDAASVVAGEGGGFGLFNIRERLQLLGAGLEIDSGAESGTTVTVTAPLAAVSEDHP